MISVLKNNLSDILSTIGILLTVIFSFGASRSARAAKTASENTRVHLNKVEITASLQDCLYMAQTLLPRIDNEEWDSIGRISSEVRLRLISALHSSDGLLDPEKLQLVESAILEFSLITNRCDRFRLSGGNAKPISKPRMLSSIHNHIGHLTVVQENAKAKLREANVSNS